MNEDETYVLKDGKWVPAEPIKYEPTCLLERFFPNLFEKLWQKRIDKATKKYK